MGSNEQSSMRHVNFTHEAEELLLSDNDLSIVWLVEVQSRLTRLLQ